MVVFDFVRHAQGYHNLSFENLDIPDPLLTPLGEQQCADLRARYAYHDKVRKLVASPLRRTLRTCLLAFAPVSARGVKVLGLPEIQEVSTLPSDVGSEPEVLRKEFSEAEVDFTRITKGWNHKGPGSPYEFELGKLEARARAARLILRELAADLAADDRVVVVTHGGFLHFLTQDYDGLGPDKGTGWQNTEWRSYVFADPTGRDEDARLKETDESWGARRGTAKGLTEQEQLELRFVYHDFLTNSLTEIIKSGRTVEFKEDYEAAKSQQEVEAQKA